MKKEDLLEWFRKLKTKDKKLFEKYTFHCTTEPINQKRIRGLGAYFRKKNINIENLEINDLEKILKDEKEDE